MEKLVIFTAVVTVTTAQVVFPGAKGSNDGTSSSNTNSDIDSQLITALSGSERNIFFPQTTNENSCRLPDSNIGNCLSFSQCSEYTHLSSALNTPSVLNFLRARVCRILSNSIQLCCPIVRVSPQNVIFQTTRRPPQTTRRPPQTTRRPPQTTFQQAPSGSQNELFPSDCGRSFSDRVVQGTEVGVGAYPWLVALGAPSLRGGDVFNVNCGGSLITRRHVLTAAHCFSSFFKPTHARLGDHDLTRNNDGALNPQTVRISSFKLDTYDPDTNHNDIAILTLERDVSFDSRIQPICLPFRPDLRNNKFVGNRMDVAGWGRTNHSIRQTSPIPLEAKVEVLDLDRCKEPYGKLKVPFFIIESQLCAGTGGADSCNGDSGGPLHYLDQGTGRYYLAGVTSFGVECGRSDFPGVYTRVGSYLNWIESNVN